MGLEKLTGVRFVNAEITADALITAADARLILRAAVGLERLK